MASDEERPGEAEAPRPGTGFRQGGVFNSAVDAIVVMGLDGLVADWNAAAERLFGYRHAEALGQELAELIIPSALRARHREGLKRLRETGEGPIIGRRLELFATRADGQLIPVELTVTAIEDSDPPLFAGFVRDRSGREDAVRVSL